MFKYARPFSDNQFLQMLQTNVCLNMQDLFLTINFCKCNPKIQTNAQVLEIRNKPLDK